MGVRGRVPDICNMSSAICGDGEQRSDTSMLGRMLGREHGGWNGDGCYIGSLLTSSCLGVSMEVGMVMVVI